MKKAAIILMLIMLVSKVIGLIRDVALAYFYGATAVSDVYLISITIPAVLFGLIVSGISTSYIPLYKKIETVHGSNEGLKYTNNLINILVILSTLFIIFGVIFTEQIVKAFASGFEGDILNLAIKFTRISLLGIYFTGLLSIFNGFLQLKNSFAPPAISALPMNLLVILSIIISSSTNYVILAIGTVLATVFQVLFLLPFLYRKGYRYEFIIDYKNDHMKTMLTNAIPVMIGSSINQLNQIVDRTIASQVLIGGISTLSYANRINGFIGGIFISAVSTAIFPSISKMAVENNIKELKRTIIYAIGSINLLVIPATIGAMIFSEEIVTLLFGRGAFDENAIFITSSALFFYSLGMLGYGLREVLSKVFYALGDSKTPMYNTILVIIINVILSINLSKVMGIGGIALATSLSDILCTSFLFMGLRKKIGSFDIKLILISFIKILFASLIMGVISKTMYIYFSNYNEIFALLISILGGIVFYSVIVGLLKINEVSLILSSIKKRI